MLLLLILTTFALICKGQLPRPQSEVKFVSATATGPGCPNIPGVKTWSVNYNSPQTAFTVFYDYFRVTKFSPKNLTENTKSCQLTFKMSIPAGYQFRLNRILSQGYAYVQKGITATRSSKYKFVKDSKDSVLVTESKPKVIQGPFTGYYNLKEDLISPELWSRCTIKAPNLYTDSYFQIFTEISLLRNLEWSAGATGQIVVDATEGVYRVGQKYVISVRECPQELFGKFKK